MKLLAEVPNNKIKIFPNSKIAYVRGVNHLQSLELEGRSLRPNEVHNLFLERPNEVRSALCSYGTYIGMAFASEKPFESYIKNGRLDFSMNYFGQTKVFHAPVEHLIKAGINQNSFAKNNQILYVVDFYTVVLQRSNRALFSVVGADEGSAQIRDWRSGGEWRKSDGGLVTIEWTGRTNAPKVPHLHNSEHANLNGTIAGSLMRGGTGWTHGEQFLNIGMWPEKISGVFKDISGTSLDMD